MPEHADELIDRDQQQETTCEDCGHEMALHGKDGCEYERGDRWLTGNQADQPTVLMAQGPCGCQAYTFEEE